MHLSSFSDPPPLLPPPHHQGILLQGRGSPTRILPEKKCTEKRFSNFFFKGENPGQACTYRHVSLEYIACPHSPQFFFLPLFDRKRGWMGRLSISSSGKKCSCSGASKKGEEEKGETMPDTQPASIPFSSFPLSMPFLPQSLLAEHFLPPPIVRSSILFSSSSPPFPL